jgi:hypothetical protein
MRAIGAACGCKRPDCVFRGACTRDGQHQLHLRRRLFLRWLHCRPPVCPPPQKRDPPPRVYTYLACLLCRCVVCVLIALEDMHKSDTRERKSEDADADAYALREREGVDADAWARRMSHAPPASRQMSHVSCLCQYLCGSMGLFQSVYSCLYVG